MSKAIIKNIKIEQARNGLELLDACVDDLGYARYMLKQNSQAANWVDSEYGISLLHKLVYSDHYKAVKLLLSFGADPNARNNNLETPLHWCAKLNSKASAQALLSFKADIDARDNSGSTAMHHAVAMETLEMIPLLMDRGADVTLPDRDGVTPIELACEKRTHTSFAIAVLLTRFYQQREIALPRKVKLKFGMFPSSQQQPLVPPGASLNAGDSFKPVSTAPDSSATGPEIDESNQQSAPQVSVIPTAVTTATTATTAGSTQQQQSGYPPIKPRSRPITPSSAKNTPKMAGNIGTTLTKQEHSPGKPMFIVKKPDYYIITSSGRSPSPSPPSSPIRSRSLLRSQSAGSSRDGTHETQRRADSSGNSRPADIRIPNFRNSNSVSANSSQQSTPIGTPLAARIPEISKIYENATRDLLASRKLLTSRDNGSRSGSISPQRGRSRRPSSAIGTPAHSPLRRASMPAIIPHHGGPSTPASLVATRSSFVVRKIDQPVLTSQGRTPVTPVSRSPSPSVPVSPSRVRAALSQQVADTLHKTAHSGNASVATGDEEASLGSAGVTTAGVSSPAYVLTPIAARVLRKSTRRSFENGMYIQPAGAPSDSRPKQQLFYDETDENGDADGRRMGTPIAAAGKHATTEAAGRRRRASSSDVGALTRSRSSSRDKNRDNIRGKSEDAGSSGNNASEPVVQGAVGSAARANSVSLAAALFPSASFVPFLPRTSGISPKSPESSHKQEISPRFLDVILAVEQCTDCASHGSSNGQSNRHDPKKYAQFANDLLESCIKLVAERRFSVRLFALKAKVNPQYSERIGALELTVAVNVGQDTGAASGEGRAKWATHTLFSKLETRSWPSIVLTRNKLHAFLSATLQEATARTALLRPRGEELFKWETPFPPEQTKYMQDAYLQWSQRMKMPARLKKEKDPMQIDFNALLQAQQQQQLASHANLTPSSVASTPANTPTHGISAQQRYQRLRERHPQGPYVLDKYWWMGQLSLLASSGVAADPAIAAGAAGADGGAGVGMNEDVDMEQLYDRIVLEHFFVFDSTKSSDVEDLDRELVADEMIPTSPIEFVASNLDVVREESSVLDDATSVLSAAAPSTAVSTSQGGGPPKGESSAQEAEIKLETGIAAVDGPNVTPALPGEEEERVERVERGAEREGEEREKRGADGDRGSDSGAPVNDTVGIAVD